MTPEQRETSDAGVIFHATLIVYGISASEEALDLWEDVQPVPAKAAASGGRWLARLMASIVFHRAAMRRLAWAYYRYVRALQTGYTYPDPYADEPSSKANLKELREDFFSLVEELAPGLLNEDRELVDDDGSIVTQPPLSNDDEIEIEEPDKDLDDDLDEIDDTSNEEVENRLINLGPVNLGNKLKEIDDDKPAREVDQARDEAHTQAGARTAAVTEREVLNAGRETVATITKQDERVIGYARVSGTGHPCGWCAMLISRGVVYRSRESAGEDNSWHDNCHCYVEPVFTMEQYAEDSRFDLNREFSGLWGTVTAGLRGDKAIAKWRHFIRYEWQPSDAQAA